jgi:WS/DGAT/MGAT family acyltransferase
VSKRIKEKLDVDHLEPISGLDASFLYIESERSPMHVGSVSVIEGSIKYDVFKETIKRRIHQFPKLRQRLVYVPMSIDYPYWVDDPHFELDMHLHRIALPGTGSWKDLRDVASMIFSEPLDQSRPLWSFTYVEGLDNIPQVPKGSVALISKIHHVAIDGIGGAGLMSLIFDLTPDAKPGPEPRPFTPRPLPNEISVVARSIKSFVSKPLKLPGLVTEAIKATVKTGMLSRIQRLDPPTVVFTSPPTPLNGIISAKRKWNSAILSLDRVKAIKTTMETSLNDVVLAICAGALRRYLAEKDELPDLPLVAMVPISTRNKGDMSAEGNQISSMLVQLATNIEDPIERLEIINDNATTAKSYHMAMGAKSLANMAEVIPFGVANQAARLYTRYNMAKLHKPVFNVTITNVPGPQFPLYLSGNKLVAVMGMAPIIDGMGLIITVFSYNGLLTISPTSDASTMPDIDVFTRYIRESANELEELVIKHSRKKKKSARPDYNNSDHLIKRVRKEIKSRPQLTKGLKGVFQVNVTEPVPMSWKFEFKAGKLSIRKGGAAQADATIDLKDDHFVRWMEGELDSTTALIQGRMAIEGDAIMCKSLDQVFSRCAEVKK